MTSRSEQFRSTILDAELLALRARHEARLLAERDRIASERQRVRDAAIVQQREARVIAWRAVAQARESV
jgi:hypothetical protein